MSRALMVPAILCVVLGAVLGSWGWGQRDEARARIIEVDDDEPSGGIFGRTEVEGAGGPAFDPIGLDGACEALYQAADLRPDLGPRATGGPASTAPLPSLLGWHVLVDAIDPGQLSEIDELAQAPDLLGAVAVFRNEVRRALAVPVDPAAAPDVRAAAQDLRAVLGQVC